MLATVPATHEDAIAIANDSVIRAGGVKFTDAQRHQDLAADPHRDDTKQSAWSSIPAHPSRLQNSG